LAFSELVDLQPPRALRAPCLYLSACSGPPCEPNLLNDEDMRWYRCGGRGACSAIQNAIDELNGEDSVTIETPPPDGEPGGKYGRLVKRRDPAFDAAIRERLQHAYGITLTERKPAAAKK
jgi:hypothetical protein